MRTRTAWSRTMALALVAAGLASAAEWKTADQPDLPKLLADAPAAKPEEIEVPVRSTRVGQVRVVPNPDGRTWDLLQFYFRQYGGPNTIVIADLGTGEQKQVDIPFAPHRYNFHISQKALAPNGKLFIGILSVHLRQRLCIYDPATNDFALDAVPLPDTLLGETHPMALGPDGKIYMAGGHPSKTATAVQVDPDTLAVTDYGPIGPTHAPSGCWAYSLAVDDRYIYIASGKVPWHIVAFDRVTRASETLHTTEPSGWFAGVGRSQGGCTAFVRRETDDKERQDFWLYQGRLVPRKDRNEPPPWPAAAASAEADERSGRPEVSLAYAEPDSEGNAALWYRTAEARAALGGKDAPGVVSEELGWRPVRFKVPVYSMACYRLMELPDGRLFGTAGSYMGNFLYDPRTGKGEHLGKIHLSHYATTIHDGIVYLSGYPSSPVFAYDPLKAWTANTIVNGKVLDEADAKANPRRLTYLKDSGAHKMYAAEAGADGRVYFGGRWYRNGNCGGFGWWDPATREAGGVWEPLSNYQINYMTTALDRRMIVISAHRVDDPLLNKPKPEQGAIFLYDTVARNFAGRIEPVMKAKGPGLVAGVGGSRVLGWTVDPDEKGVERKGSSILYGVDAVEGVALFRKTVPVDFPLSIGENQMGAFDWRLGPDGCVWTFMSGVLVRIDPRDASVRPVCKVRGGRIAFSGNDVYLSGETILRLPGILAQAGRGK